MGDWSQTPGFPLVTAKLENKTLTLTQKRFMRDTGIENDKRELYDIPITYSIDSLGASDTKVAAFFMKEDENEMKLELPKAPERHYILNNKQIGYYRVNYDLENWMNIRKALYSGGNFDGIHVLNRAQIVDDLFQFARAGTVEYKTAIDIIRYIRDETDYIPWLTAINHGLSHLSQRVKLDEKQQDLFAWFVKNSTETIYSRLGFEPKTSDKRTDIYNRANILNWACKYGHEDCIAKSMEHFAKYISGTKVHKDLRATVYCNAIRYGNDTHYNYLDAQYAKSNIMQEQLNILSGLGCTKSEANSAKYLDRLLKTDEVRRQDWSAALSNLLTANPESVDFFYNYITANHAAWKTKFGSLSYLTTVAGRFTSAEQFDKYAKFLADNRNAVGADQADSLKRNLDSMKAANLKWDEEKMTKFMEYVEEISAATFTTFSVLLSAITVTILYIFN